MLLFGDVPVFCMNTVSFFFFFGLWLSFLSLCGIFFEVLTGDQEIVSTLITSLGLFCSDIDAWVTGAEGLCT